MKQENCVIFERDNEDEPAVIISFGDLCDLDNPKVQELLRSIDVSTSLLGELLKMEFDPSKVNTFSIPNEKGIIKEDIEQQIVDTSLGKVEISDCKLYKTAVEGRNDLGLHLKNQSIRGFEAILALSGQATLAFPEKVEPIGGLYFGSGRKEVVMTPGTLAIVPAPTASGWTSISGESFEFRYISLPPWSPDFFRPIQ